MRYCTPAFSVWCVFNRPNCLHNTAAAVRGRHRRSVPRIQNQTSYFVCSAAMVMQVRTDGRPHCKICIAVFAAYVRMLSSAIVAQCAPVLTSVPARANNTQDLQKSRMMGAIHTHTRPRLCAQKKIHNERHTRKVKSVHISRLYEICPALTAAQRAQTSIAGCTRRRRPAR